jgi:hypothetical protein
MAHMSDQSVAVIPPPGYGLTLLQKDAVSPLLRQGSPRCALATVGLDVPVVGAEAANR